MLGLLPLAGQFILAFLVFLSALKYPPYVLFVFLLFSFSDSYGVACAVTPGYFGVILDPLLLLASASAFHGLWLKKDSSRPCSRMFNTAALMAIATLWIGLSVYANGSSIRQMLVAMSVKGPHPIIIAMAYWNDQRARKLFLAVVITQLFLAFGSLLYPDGPFSIIQAFRYNAYAIDSNILEFRFERISAQFLNSLHLAFYAGVAMIVSVYLWQKPATVFMRTLSAAIGVVALTVNYQTISRGVWLATIFAIVLLVVKRPRYAVTAIVLFVSLIALIILIPALNQFIDIATYSEYVGLRFSILDSSGIRMIGYNQFGSNFIRHPLFGVGDIKFDLFMPHILFLDYALLYGFLPGFLIMVLMYRSLMGIFKSLVFRGKKSLNNSLQNRDINDKDIQLAMMFGILSLFVAMTNGSSGKTLQFICLGFSCLPWIMSEGKKHFSTEVQK